mgnify:CR=1 FL=1
MHLYKSNIKMDAEAAIKKAGKEVPLIYDQVKRDEEDQGGYQQKAPRESVWYKKPIERDQAKETQNAPLTSSQIYGWRTPIDNMNTGFQRSAVCKRTFFDKGHL